MEARTKKAKKNILYATISQVAKALLLFLSRIIFARVLGPEYLGINGLFSNILTILSLADLGMSTAMMYSLYEPLANNKKDLVYRYISYFKKVYNYVAVFILVTGLSLMPFLKFIVNLPSNIDNAYIYYLILLLNTVFSYLFIYKTTLLLADQKSYVISKYDTIMQFVQFLLQLVVLLVLHSFTIYLIIQVFCTVMGNVFKVISVRRLYPDLERYKYGELSKKEKKAIFDNIKSLFFYKIGSIIQSNTDSILVSVFVGTVTVGYYSNYSLIILQITNFLTIIFTALKATLANYNVNADKETKLKMFDRLEFINYVLVGSSAIYLLVLVPGFIEICFGKDYVLDQICLIFIIANYYTSNIRQTMWAYRETSGIFKKVRYITIVTSLINLVLSIIMGKQFGLAGIVLATVISRMVYAWWREPLIIYRDVFGSKPKVYYFRYITRLIIICLAGIALSFICGLIMVDNILFGLAIKFVITTTALAALYIGIYSRSDEFMYLKGKCGFAGKSSENNT